MSRIAEPEGVDEEWATVYADHGPAVFSFASTWLCDVALAEEVVQDVFFNLWSRVDCFDHARGSIALPPSRTDSSVLLGSHAIGGSAE